MTANELHARMAVARVRLNRYLALERREVTAAPIAPLVIRVAPRARARRRRVTRGARAPAGDDDGGGDGCRFTSVSKPIGGGGAA